MSIFGNLKNDGLEKAKDTLGGNFGPVESGLYTGTIKVAWTGTSAKGSRFVEVILGLENDREFIQRFYVTNQQGDPFWVNKTTGKKMPLAGFTHVDDICLVTADKPLAAIEPEERTINLWDSESKSQKPQSVPVLLDLVGKQVTFGVLKQLVNKREQVGDEWKPIADFREENEVDKIFHYPTGLTVREAENGATEAVFKNEWEKKNKGVTRDRRTIKDGATAQGGRPGRPGGGAGGPPQAGDTGAKKTSSLFGK